MSLTLEQILCATQDELKQLLFLELQNLGYDYDDILWKDGYVYAPGDVPVMLVAHMDTVHKQPPADILYTKDGKKMLSLQGIGGDDRLGVYTILNLLKEHKCHVLFCEDEETGRIGATKFVQAPPDLSKVNYIVELDRRGTDDCVFYGCDNPDFEKFVESFGYKTAIGSCSDISVIAPATKIAAVNLSTGFFHEHTTNEYIDLAVHDLNLERVGRMVTAPSERFEYIPAATPCLSSYRYGRYDYDNYDWLSSKSYAPKLKPLFEDDSDFFGCDLYEQCDVCGAFGPVVFSGGYSVCESCYDLGGVDETMYPCDVCGVEYFIDDLENFENHLVCTGCAKVIAEKVMGTMDNLCLLTS